MFNVVYLFDGHSWYSFYVSDELAVVFGETLRMYRKKLGWSQMKLAMEADMHLNAIGNLERGERNPSLQTVVTLCQALGVKPSEILKDIEEML